MTAYGESSSRARAALDDASKDVEDVLAYTTTCGEALNVRAQMPREDQQWRGALEGGESHEDPRASH
eukprot:4182686-Pyramimonas_sp.AAC.1